MKRIKRTWLLFLPLLLASCATKPDTVELTEWEFKYNDQWYPATVPGFIHTDLMANGLIPDPYYGTNEDSVQWVGDSVWVYQTTICKKNLPEGDTLWLVFEGLTGPADIRVSNTNSQFEHLLWVPDAENMYRKYEFPFPNIEDTIIIRVKFLPLDDSLREAEYGITLPERRAFTRIAPYQQGWDWGPKLTTCGIWKPVYITSDRPVRAYPRVRPQDDDKGVHRGTPVQTGNDKGVHRGTPVQTGNNKGVHGSTPVQTDNITLRQEPDSIGQSFTFYKDGKSLFIKGANWIPIHSFPVDDSANRARYRYLLCSAKEAGFNMIRIWGGGIYEHDYFYDLCDSLGLMVWQDFIFAGTPYPDSPEMLESIRQEARQQVSRLARHPCIVLWCGNNEVKNGWEDWGWQSQFNWTPEQRARLEKAMDTIFGTGVPQCTPTSNGRTGVPQCTPTANGRTQGYAPTGILAQAVHDCDPLQRPYITTSPLYGWGHPECVTHGDSHYWGVWWGEMPFEVYKEKTGRFMSEYGFQSYPMLSTIKQFCPEDQLSIDSPTLRNHQKHGRGLQIIDKAMRQYYGFDSRSLSLEDFAYVSQLLQAWGVGYAIFQHISQQPHCMGTLYWQLNDCWPVASWSSIDYYGNWKALHYRAQDLYADNVDLQKWADYYSVYPKDRTYPEARYTLAQTVQKDGSLTVKLTAQTDLHDLYLDTEPHVNGHFTRNFVFLPAGQTLEATLVPADPKADLSHVRVTVRTLNDLYKMRNEK